MSLRAKFKGLQKGAKQKGEYIFMMRDYFLSVSERCCWIHKANEDEVSIHRDDELVEPAEKDVVIEVSCVLLFWKTHYKGKIARI